MISVTVFNVLLVLAVILFVYSLVDLSNRIYGNIALSFFSALLSGYVAVIANTGVVEDAGTVMQDMSLQIMLIIFAMITAVYTIYMAVEAWYEYQAGKEEI